MQRLALLAALLLATIDCASAQATQAQRDDIRAACRSDFIANCSGVQPGGKDALQCLARNSEKLSAACKTAVSAVTTKPAAPAEAAPPASAAPAMTEEPAPAPPPKAAATESQRDQLSAVRKVCTLDDFLAHCSWIQPSDPELLLCLSANTADLSPACKAAVAELSSSPTPAAVETPPHVPAPSKKPAEPERASAPAPAPAAAAPQKPSQEQASAIRSACRFDFISHCSGVQPGGAAALQCLQRNSAALSATCKSAVAAVGGGGTPGTATAGPPNAAPAPTPAVAPLGPMPAIRPREALQILRICGGDQQAFCAGFPIGGGRVISCLAENAAKLSPGCYAALREVAGR